MQGSARGDPDMLTGLFGRSAALRRLLPGLPVVAAQRRATSTVPRGRPSLAVDWLSGACMLARRDALAPVGGFDERYFLYWEDADLCRRLRARGYHVRYVPSATAVHRVGHSSRTARGAVAPGVSRQRLPVLRDARRAGRAQPQAAAGAGAARRCAAGGCCGRCGSTRDVPLTIAHPVAAIPLRRPLGRMGVLAALVIGSITPDVPLFLPLPLGRNATHSAIGLLWFCLPVGVLAYLLYDRVLDRPLRALMPEALQRRLAAGRP